MWLNIKCYVLRTQPLGKKNFFVEIAEMMQNTFGLVDYVH